MSGMRGPRMGKGPSDGDWICEEVDCGNMNFARRTACHRCGAEKKMKKTKKLGVEIGSGLADKSNGLFSADDWQCGKCGNVNWARRSNCNVCNGPKYTVEEERTGLGGGFNERGIVEYKDRQESDDEYDDFGRLKHKKKKAYTEGRIEGSVVGYDELEDDEPDQEEDEDEEEEDDGDLSKYDLWGADDQTNNDNNKNASNDKSNNRSASRSKKTRSRSSSSSSSSRSRSRSRKKRSRSRSKKKSSRRSRSSSTSSSSSRSRSRSRGKRNYGKSRRSKSRSKSRGKKRSRSSSRGGKKRSRRSRSSSSSSSSRSRSSSRDRSRKKR